MNALIDTGVLRDYLMGDARAAKALDACVHRSISVVTWLELMAQCPTDLAEPTRAYLRSFERLSVSEAIADEAHRLMSRCETLTLDRALTWATAALNQLVLVTSEPVPELLPANRLRVPYRALPVSVG